MRQYLARLVLLSSMCVSATTMALSIINQTTQPLECEFVTTDQTWAYHKFTVDPGDTHDEDFTSTQESPAYYRLAIKQTTGLFHKHTYALSGKLRDQQAFIAAFDTDSNTYVFYEDGNVKTADTGPQS